MLYTVRHSHTESLDSYILIGVHHRPRKLPEAIWINFYNCRHPRHTAASTRFCYRHPVLVNSYSIKTAVWRFLYQFEFHRHGTPPTRSIFDFRRLSLPALPPPET